MDDILIASQYKDELQEIKRKLSSKFEMKDLGPARHLLGMDMQTDQTVGILHLPQQGYLQKVVGRFMTHESKPMGKPLNII